MFSFLVDMEYRSKQKKSRVPNSLYLDIATILKTIRFSWLYFASKEQNDYLVFFTEIDP